MRHEAPSRDDVKIMLSFMPWRRATDATDTRGCSTYAMRGHQTIEHTFEDAGAAMKEQKRECTLRRA